MSLFPTNYSTQIILANGIQYSVPLLSSTDGNGFEHYYILIEMTNLLGIENEVKKPSYIFESGHPAFFVEFFLILFGILCNSATALIIMCTRLIRTNANKYICIILIADTIYLLCIFGDLVFHIRTVNFHLCALEELFNHCSVYVSSICIVLLTVERFLAIVCPMEHMQIADSNRWFLISFAIFPFLICQTVIFFLILVDISQELHIGYAFKCKFEMSGPLKGVDFLVDNVVQFIFPLISVTFLNIVIAFKIRNSTDSTFLTGSIARPKSNTIEMKASNKNTSIESNQPNNGNGTRINIEEEPKSETCANTPKFQSTVQQSISPSVPGVLFIIPCIYILLNSPFYGIQFSLPEILTYIGNLIFIANYASNAILYAISSTAFRQQVLMICRHKSENNFSSTNLTSISHSRPHATKNFN